MRPKCFLHFTILFFQLFTRQSKHHEIIQEVLKGMEVKIRAYCHHGQLLLDTLPLITYVISPHFRQVNSSELFALLMILRIKSYDIVLLFLPWKLAGGRNPSKIWKPLQTACLIFMWQESNFLYRAGLWPAFLAQNYLVMAYIFSCSLPPQFCTFC